MISDEQMVEMAPRISAMMQTPGWKDYVSVIADKIAITTQLGFGGNPEDLRYHQGSVDGLTAAVASATDVLNQARTTTGEKAEARRRSISSKSSSTFD